MRRITSLLSVLLAFVAIAGFAQNKKDSYITEVDVKTTTSQTPQFNAGGVPNINVKPKHWLLIMVTYRPAKIAGKDETYMWRDDLSIKFEAIIENGNRATLLSRVIDYWAVCFDGEYNNAVAFIPEDIFNRFAPENTKLKKSAVPVKVTFLINEAPVAIAYSKVKGGDAKKVFEGLGNSPNTRRVPDAILSRNQTPWSVLNFDGFELIKEKK